MRVGLIARADSRGLGVQTKAFHDVMRPAKTMVVDCPSADPLPLRPDWYPGSTWIKGLPKAGDFRSWLDGLDVVYTAETGYGRAVWSEAERAGVKTVLHANYEFLDRSDQPTLWAAPSMWHFDEFPDPRRFLPVPIDLAKFPARQPTTKAARFLHVIGRPAIHDRNGTADLLDALAYVQSPITLTITCQNSAYVPGLLASRRIPRHIHLDIRSGDAPNNVDLYREQDVLVLPRRFGGLCLPAQEALGAGMPVLMPAVSPNEWLPSDWLVSAEKRGEFTAKTRVELYSVGHRDLAAKIDQLAQDPTFFAASQDTARRMAKELSWDNQRPVYEKLFADLCNR
ncbi:glycosyltransferase [Nocardia asiatica]|uniref:glycosyltransferase n=1 Tax=Nocardia asiatica TaxID=209252 RepID=UPI0002DF274A|nr:glycosyltransferase [Nocardia asiatica]